MKTFTIRFNSNQHTFFRSALAHAMTNAPVAAVAPINTLSNRIAQLSSDARTEYEMDINEAELKLLQDAVVNRNPESYCKMLHLDKDSWDWDDICFMTDMLETLQAGAVNGLTL